MRLLNVDSFEFTEFHEDKRPRYAILSHRWVDGSEVTLQDISNKRNTDRSGYKKILEFAKYVQKHVIGVEWLWVDTCCIDKTNAAELSKSLNLMFDWYRDAVLCIAYLADVRQAEYKCTLQRSEWFKRGWTLQELLAPRLVIFVTEAWQVIGNKGAPTNGNSETVGPSLENDIAAITGIPELVIYNYAASTSFSIDEKLAWMEGRETTQPEDMSYALYGIFGVTPGANYGEKHEGARQRLLAAIHYQENLAAEQADRFQQIVAWLSPPDPWMNHQSARQLHETQTGSWLLQSTQYQDWKTSLSNRHIWMHGKAGCGKTVLCSTVIEDVKSYCERQPNVGYAFFYFSFSDDQKRQLVNLLCSLVTQLGWKGLASSMLREAYDKPNRRKLGIRELEDILLACFKAYDEVFILVDALDESPEENDVQQSMLEGLIRLSQTALNVKVFATSRELPGIRVSMGRLGALPLAIAIRAVDEDIRQYIAKQLTYDHRLSRLEQNTKALIEERLSVTANGMFRWVYCQLQELKKLKSTRPTLIRNALDSLPSTLDETYERMLVGIDNALRADALTLLRLLTYAKSPLTLIQLVDVAIIELGAEGAVRVEDRPGLLDTLEILSGMVVAEQVEEASDDSDFDLVSDLFLDGGNASNQVGKPKHEGSGSWNNETDRADPRGHLNGYTKVRLAHFSVREYLESTRILQSNAKDFHLQSATEHGVISRSCLIYLMHWSSSNEKRSYDRDTTKFPLLGYAAGAWYYHAARQHTPSMSYEAHFLSNEDHLRSWLNIWHPDIPVDRQYERPNQHGSAIYYASYTGLQAAVDKLLELGLDVNAKGGRYGNALQAASYAGYETIARILLDAGADVNAKGGLYSNALVAASVQGHDDVVKMLLHAGADLHAREIIGGNALRAALIYHQGKVVKTLMDAGADMDDTGGLHSNALHAALDAGYDEGVQMLLDAGADVHAPAGPYDDALQATSAKGNDKVVRMLLSAGADLHTEGEDREHALYAASDQGHTKVVQTLLEAGADVNALGVSETTALFAAATHGYKDVVQMLLDFGARVNIPAAEYGNALVVASYMGHEEIVRMFLSVGANATNRRGDWDNALEFALLGGHKKIARLLKEHGAVRMASPSLRGFRPKYARKWKR